MQPTKYNLLTILGPTACGKTKLAVHLAEKLEAEIISADSRQVYRNMNIGTGKDLGEYTINNHAIPYHLIDICEAGQKYNVFEYQQDFIKAFEDITSRQKTPILCGGSGLYLEAILKQYQLLEVEPNAQFREKLEKHSTDELIQMLAAMKKLHNSTDLTSRKRIIRAIEIETFYKENPEKKIEFPQIYSLNIGLNIEAEKRRAKITARLKARLEEGMIEEVQKLLDAGISADDLIYYGLEYKYLTLYLCKKISYNEMFTQLEIAIHQFAKRQMTYFRGMERRGLSIVWLDAELPLEEKINKCVALQII